MPTQHLPDPVAVWWAAEYIVICEQPDRAVRGEFGRRYRDQAKHQGPDNSVFGSAKSPTNVDIEHAYLVPAEDWETGMDGDDAQLSLS
jgi:hypothetical protein